MTEVIQIRDMLNEIPLFAGSSTEVLAQIAGIAEERNFDKGDIIYNAGDQALEMFVLINGLVSFTTPSGVGHLHAETLMKRYMIFGWAALIPEHPRRLGIARCLESSKLLAINGDRVMEILGRSPQSGFLVMTRLCSMIASTFMVKR